MIFWCFFEAWDSKAIESAAAALLRGWQDPSVEAPMVWSMVDSILNDINSIAFFPQKFTSWGS